MQYKHFSRLYGKEWDWLAPSFLMSPFCHKIDFLKFYAFVEGIALRDLLLSVVKVMFPAFNGPKSLAFCSLIWTNDPISVFHCVSMSFSFLFILAWVDLAYFLLSPAMHYQCFLLNLIQYFYMF